MIRPTFLAFETAKRALNVSQAGLDTVGHNISNANTPGYTRQRVDQVSLSLNGVAQKYQTFGASFTGLGSDIKAISQIRDPYLDTRYRSQASVNGELGVKNYGLTDINNIFDETTTDGLQAKLSELLKALDDLSTKADSTEYATMVRTTADKLVSLLNSNAATLENDRALQKLDLNTTVTDDVNNVLTRIANLNVAIKQDNFYGNPANELNDERNMLIDQLSEYLDIRVERTPVEVSKGVLIENVSIYLNDGSNPPIALVESGFCNQLGVTEDEATGNVKISLIDGISGAVNTKVGKNGDITSNICGGALKGYIDIINGAGPGAPDGVSTFRGIPYYQDLLDEFAQKLASVFNDVNNISDGDILNNDTAEFYSPTFEKNLFAPLAPTILSYSGANNWIGAFNTGTLGFSSSTPYNIEFTTDGNTPPDEVTAKVKINGQEKTYTAKYSATGEMHFIGEDDTVAFSITGNGTLPENGSSIRLDASVTAKNISIAKNWKENPLYITATKKKPVDEAKTVLAISGSTPSWLKSVENGNAAIKVPDGSYKFYDSGDGYLKVNIDKLVPDPSDPDKTITQTVTYTSTKKIADMKADEQIDFADTDGIVGLSLTLSSTFDAKAVNFKADGDTKNIVNIKNETAALNDNILKFKNAMEADNFYSVSGFTGSFQKFVVSFEGEMALDMKENTDLLATANVVIGSYADRRDAVSAVSVDEEAINMMTYQNYYNAAARYMNVIDEALDKIINGMGMVGR